MPKYSLLIGRFQPFHAGHRALIDTLLAEGRSVLVAIRDTPQSETDPYTIAQRWEMIREAYPDRVRVAIMYIADIEAVVFGRQVGYAIREIHLDPATEAISATAIRRQGSP